MRNLGIKNSPFGIFFQGVKLFAFILKAAPPKKLKISFSLLFTTIYLLLLRSTNSFLDDILLEKNYYKKYLINGIDFGLVDLRPTGDIIEKDIHDLKHNLTLFLGVEQLKGV